MTCSAVLVVDELLPQAVVDRRCCKRPSRLRIWSVAHTPRSLVKPHLDLPQFIVLSLYRPEAAFLQEASTLYILETQRVCSVS